MKKYSLLVLALLASFAGRAQTQKVISNGIGIGFHLSQFQRDFGMGLNLTSPYFAKDKIAIRARSNLMFHENVQNTVSTWTPYLNMSLGLIGVSGNIGDYIRLYGEGGITGLLPSSKFSSQQFAFGGYGLFGFEFFMKPNHNYFIEIGGIGTGAREDKSPTQPIYSNGLIISAGFRFNLK